jgi:hypothetical protein
MIKVKKIISDELFEGERSTSGLNLLTRKKKPLSL